MEKQELDVLNLKKQEGKSNEEKRDIDVLNLKKQEEFTGNGNLAGTGIKALRVISTIMIILGVILFFFGFIEIADESSLHPEKMYIGWICITGAISCFVAAPVYKVLATIGEAAKLYRDKNTKSV